MRRRLPAALAILTSGVVACRAPPTTQVDPAPAPQTSASTTATITNSNAADAGVSDAMTAQETVVTWGTLRWEMDRAAAIAELKKKANGEKVDDRGGKGKSPTTWISADYGASGVTVYFDEAGKMNQITIITEPKNGVNPLNEADILERRRAFDRRFGTAASDRRSVEKQWKLTNDAHVTARVAQQEGKTWGVHEERGRGKPSNTSSSGFADLAWGTSLADVETKLKAAGFATKVRSSKASGNAPDPCQLPNAPPNCKSVESSSLEATKTDGAITISADLSIAKAAGLGQISINKRGYDTNKAAMAEVEAIEKANGLPESTSREQQTKWRPGTGEAVFDARQREGKWSTIETYRPKAETP